MVEKALILAGGSGTRLWPLTDPGVRPKPAVYVGGVKRLIEYLFDRFVEADYQQIYVNIAYMADYVRQRFGDGSDYSYGGEPLRLIYTHAVPGDPSNGSADGLRKSRFHMADALKVRNRKTQDIVEVNHDTFRNERGSYRLQGLVENFDQVVVAPGDILFNKGFNIRELVNFHKDRGGIATMALYRMDDVARIVNNLGTVEIDKDGLVTGFWEKPKTAEEVKSNLINTGIYVFEREIFDWLDKNGQAHDFAKDVFPALMREYHGNGMFGLPMKGCWEDLGTIESYRDTNLKLIDGIIGIDTSSQRLRAQTPSNPIGVLMNSLSGSGLKIGYKGVVVHSVIGNDVTIGDHCYVRDCIVGAGAKIGDGIKLNNVIIDGDVHVEKGALIGEGVVIGKGAHIMPDAVIHPSVKIAPGEEPVSGEITKDVRHAD